MTPPTRGVTAELGTLLRSSSQRTAHFLPYCIKARRLDAQATAV